MPAFLKKWEAALIENIAEVRSDYVFSMKKAVVDFVLRHSVLDRLTQEGVPHIFATAERKEIDNLKNHFRYR